ncbi:hypothetical protein ACFFLM_03255 [Deinococcus oregonensis]|uniref:Uncharacterized protein n=1 Tax=Deinococcus oregonensis TaxID=1805970 RepID=A0ABV6AU25_9DEIO
MNLQEALGVWDVQANGQVLCPHSGVRLSVSHGGARARLELNTGHRTVFDVRRGGLLFAPAVRTEGRLSLRAISERELRDERRVSAALETLASFGGTAGVLTTCSWNRERWNLFAQTEAGTWVDVHRTLRDQAQAQRAAEEEARRAEWAARGRPVRRTGSSSFLGKHGLLLALAVANMEGGRRE